MLRSFVNSTVGFSLVWLCLCSIATRLDNNWQNLKGKEGKFWEKRKWGRNGICRPFTLVLCSILWLRKEGEDNLDQLSLQASQSFGACLFLSDPSPIITEWHFSFETGIETKNVTLLTLTFWFRNWFRNQKCHTLPLGGCANFRQKHFLGNEFTSIWYKLHFTMKGSLKTLLSGKCCHSWQKNPYTPVPDEFLVQLWGEGTPLATHCRYWDFWAFPY